jgi:hypothetical protein
MKVPAPHNSEAQQNDRDFQGQGHESAQLLPSLQSFSQSSQVSKAINSSTVSVGPPRLQCVAAYEVETDELKTRIRIRYLSAAKYDRARRVRPPHPAQGHARRSISSLKNDSVPSFQDMASSSPIC